MNSAYWRIMRRVNRVFANAATASIALTGMVTACASVGQSAQSMPNVATTKQASSYGVPTSGVNDLKLSCQLTAPNGLPEYESTLVNPTSYAIQVSGWQVILHNQNGTRVTDSPNLGGFEVDGNTSISWDTVIPTDLIYSYNSAWRTIVTSCRVSKVW